MTQFMNFYECPKCKLMWRDAWSSTSDDECPDCGMRHISPYESKEIKEASEECNPEQDIMEEIEIEWIQAQASYDVTSDYI